MLGQLISKVLCLSVPRSTLDTEVCPCMAGSEARRDWVWLRSRDLRTMETVRMADVREGRLHSQLQGSMNKAINARKPKEMGSPCTCHSGRMISLSLIQPHLPAFQEADHGGGGRKTPLEIEYLQSHCPGSPGKLESFGRDQVKAVRVPQAVVLPELCERSLNDKKSPKSRMGKGREMQREGLVATVLGPGTECVCSSPPSSLCLKWFRD